MEHCCDHLQDEKLQSNEDLPGISVVSGCFLLLGNTFMAFINAVQPLIKRLQFNSEAAHIHHHRQLKEKETTNRIRYMNIRN